MRSVIIILTILLTSLTGHAGQTITLAAYDDEPSVVSSAILRKAYARLGIVVVLKAMPGNRALTESNLGFLDGELHRIAGLENDFINLVQVPVAINRIEGVAVTCAPAVVLKNKQDIAQHHVGIESGVQYAEDLVSDIRQVSQHTSMDMLFDRLIAGRLDVIITEPEIVEAQRRRTGKTCLTIFDPPLMTVPLFHYLHKQHKHIVPALTRILERMRDSGEMDTIRRNVVLGGSSRTIEN